MDSGNPASEVWWSGYLWSSPADAVYLLSFCCWMCGPGPLHLNSTPLFLQDALTLWAQGHKNSPLVGQVSDRQKYGMITKFAPQAYLLFKDTKSSVLVFWCLAQCTPSLFTWPKVGRWCCQNRSGLTTAWVQLCATHTFVVIVVHSWTV